MPSLAPAASSIPSANPIQQGRGSGCLVVRFIHDRRPRRVRRHDGDAGWREVEGGQQGGGGSRQKQTRCCPTPADPPWGWGHPSVLGPPSISSTPLLPLSRGLLTWHTNSLQSIHQVLRQAPGREWGAEQQHRSARVLSSIEKAAPVAPLPQEAGPFKQAVRWAGSPLLKPGRRRKWPCCPACPAPLQATRNGGEGWTGRGGEGAQEGNAEARPALNPTPAKHGQGQAIHPAHLRIVATVRALGSRLGSEQLDRLAAMAAFLASYPPAATQGWAHRSSCRAGAVCLSQCAGCVHHSPAATKHGTPPFTRAAT